MEHAASLEELEDALTCETDKGCCIFNTTCKVLFTYDEAKNEAELIEYSFKITENGP
ncbi:hypothetical protein IBTHAUMO2_570011 [Nitrosopumilaceae archaeon]|nr:hypothetical protein IBTHAUMO2_570011 [Nitrosopumilaceae archaeon]